MQSAPILSFVQIQPPPKAAPSCSAARTSACSANDTPPQLKGSSKVILVRFLWGRFSNHFECGRVQLPSLQHRRPELEKNELSFHNFSK